MLSPLRVPLMPSYLEWIISLVRYSEVSSLLHLFRRFLGFPVQRIVSRINLKKETKIHDELRKVIFSSIDQS